MKRIAVLAALLMAGATTFAQADDGTPLRGYICMELNQTEAQSRDPNFRIPVYSLESVPNGRADFKQVGLSASVVIVKQPSHVIARHLEILRFNGQPAWIALDAVKPMRNPCTPERRADGRVGTGR